MHWAFKVIKTILPRYSRVLKTVINTSEKAFSCRLCGSSALELIFEQDLFPKSIWPKAQGEADTFIPLRSYICDNCGHLQLSNYSDDEVASFYEGNHFVLSDSCPKEHRFKEVNKLFAHLNQSGSKLIDIGGGVNTIVTQFADCTEKFVGDFFIGNEIEKDQSITKFRGDLTKMDFPEKSFDGIFLFHCLEHLNHPQEMIARLRTSLKDDGLLFVEVPDSMFYARKVPHYLFFHQHLNLFHKKSLALFFDYAGMDIIHRFNIDGVLFFALKKCEKEKERASVKEATKRLMDVFSSNMESLHMKAQRLREKIQQGQRVSLYGAGGSQKLFVHYFLSGWDLACAYDQDHLKHQKALYDAKTLIHGPQQIKIDEPDWLLFMSRSIYNQMKNVDGVRATYLFEPYDEENI